MTDHDFDRSKMQPSITDRDPGDETAARYLVEVKYFTPLDGLKYTFFHSHDSHGVGERIERAGKVMTVVGCTEQGI